MNKVKYQKIALNAILIAFTTILLMSCRAQKTIDTEQKDSVKREMVEEYEQTVKDSCRIFAHIDSIVIEEYCPSDIVNVEEQGNGTGNKLGARNMMKRKVMVYGLSKQKQDIKHIERACKENMKTDSITYRKEAQEIGKRKHGGFMAGVAFSVIILFFVALIVVWKIAVQ